MYKLTWDYMGNPWTPTSTNFPNLIQDNNMSELRLVAPQATPNLTGKDCPIKIEMLAVFQLPFLTSPLFSPIFWNGLLCRFVFLVLLAGIIKFELSQVKKSHGAAVAPRNMPLGGVGFVARHPPPCRPCLGRVLAWCMRMLYREDWTIWFLS